MAFHEIYKYSFTAKKNLHSWIIKMKFILNSTVLFVHGEMNYLQVIGDVRNLVQLSSTSADLLKLLLLAKGREVSLNWIIYFLWISKGKSGSYNNVTLSVFNLRKAFDNVGLNRDLIINTQGKGYSLKIHFQIENENATTIKNDGGRKRKPRIKIVYTLICVSVIVAIYTLFENAYNKNRFDFAYQSGTVGKCAVYTFDQLSSTQVETIMKLIKNEAVNIDDCKEEEKIFVFVPGAFDLERPELFYIGRCITNNDKIIACKNYVRMTDE